jgi:hypothetical protein
MGFLKVREVMWPCLVIIEMSYGASSNRAGPPRGASRTAADTAHTVRFRASAADPHSQPAPETIAISLRTTV